MRYINKLWLNYLHLHFKRLAVLSISYHTVHITQELSVNHRRLFLCHFVSKKAVEVSCPMTNHGTECQGEGIGISIQFKAVKCHAWMQNIIRWQPVLKDTWLRFVNWSEDLFLSL